MLKHWWDLSYFINICIQFPENLDRNSNFSEKKQGWQRTLLPEHEHTFSTNRDMNTTYCCPNTNTNTNTPTSEHEHEHQPNTNTCAGSSYIITMCDHHIRSSYMMIIYDDHIWWSYTIIIYDDHICWSYVTIICDHHVWSSYMSL